MVYDIHIILLANAFSTPIAKCFDPIFFQKKIMLYFIKKKGEECTIPQHYANDWFEGNQIYIAENYAYVTRVLYITTWYL